MTDPSGIPLAGLGLAQTIQEDLWIVLGLLGVYDFGVAKFVLEKLLRWMDRVEQKHSGRVTLLFDSAPRTCA